MFQEVIQRHADQVQAVVDFLGLKIDVAPISFCSDPSGRMHHVVRSVMSRIQLLVPHSKTLLEQSLAVPEYLHDRPTHVCERARPDFASLASEPQQQMSEAGTPWVEISANFTSAVRDAKGCEGPCVSGDGGMPAQKSVAAPDRSSMEQAVIATPDHRSELHVTPCSPSNRHETQEAPYASPATRGGAMMVSAPIRASSQTHMHSSPPTLTCNFPDLLATPPSQRQQRQTFPETEVFVPFFGAQLPGDSGIPAGALLAGPGQCTNKPANDAAATDLATNTVTAVPEYGLTHPTTDRSDQAWGCEGVAPEEARGCHANTTRQPQSERAAPPLTISAPVTVEAASIEAAYGSLRSNQPAPDLAAAATMEVSKTHCATEPGQRPMPLVCVPQHKPTAKPPPAPLLAASAADCGRGLAASVPHALGGSFGWRPLGARPAVAKHPPALPNHACAAGSTATPSIVGHPGALPPAKGTSTFCPATILGASVVMRSIWPLCNTFTLVSRALRLGG